MSRTADHVAAFNRAVTSGDWDTFAERFAADATMRFTGIPSGPFEGRTAIAAAYRENPPAETMTLLEDGDEVARFRWSGGLSAHQLGRCPMIGTRCELTDRGAASHAEGTEAIRSRL